MGRDTVTAHHPFYFKEVGMSAVADTLALVNVARQAFGKDMLTDLPDSRPGAASDCLFYRALADVGVRSVGSGGEMEFDDPRKASYLAHLWGTSCSGNTVFAPKQFGEVISDFDRGSDTQASHYRTTAPKHF